MDNDGSNSTNITHKMSTGTLGQTLSRTSVYAPLQSYDSNTSTTTVKNNSNINSTYKVPKSLHDSNLLSFYTSISYDYHRTIPRLDMKNTSGRPLSINDITSRINQRALTFVGNGYYINNKNKNQQLTKKKKKKKKKVSIIKCNTKSIQQQQQLLNVASYNISTKQRIVKRSNLMKRIYDNNKSNDTNSYKDDITMDDNDVIIVDHTNNTRTIQHQECVHEIQEYLQHMNLDFLIQFNLEWNLYIQDLLQLDTTTTSMTTSTSNTISNNRNDDSNDHSRFLHRIELRIEKLLQNNNMIEWIGSFVRISEYTHDKSRSNEVDINDLTTRTRLPNVQRYQLESEHKKTSKYFSMIYDGILISHTPNHWIVAVVMMNNTFHDDDDHSNSNYNKNNDEPIDIVTNKEETNRAKNVISDVPTLSPLQQTVKISRIQKVSKMQATLTVRIPLQNDNNISFIDYYGKNEIQSLNIHLQHQS